jgi:hypothetical protein
MHVGKSPTSALHDLESRVKIPLSLLLASFPDVRGDDETCQETTTKQRKEKREASIGRQAVFAPAAGCH